MYMHKILWKGKEEKNNHGYLFSVGEKWVGGDHRQKKGFAV